MSSLIQCSFETVLKSRLKVIIIYGLCNTLIKTNIGTVVESDLEYCNVASWKRALRKQRVFNA